MIDTQKYATGLVGEGVIRDWLKDHKIHHLQADLLFYYKDKWYIAEIKHQERFEPPPFDGHGLPRWQVDARLKFQQQTGIRAVFFVVEKPSGIVFWNYIDELVKGESLQTKGTKPRLIFPVKSFNILEMDNR